MFTSPNIETFIYNKEKCTILANKYGGKLVSSNVVSDVEPITFMCKYGHVFDDYPCAIDNRDYYCPKCEHRNSSQDIDSDGVLYILEQLYKKSFNMILNLENAKLFINDDLKIGYFLISPKFYNTVQYTVVHVLKGDYLNKGYKMIILDTYIPKQDMVEHIIGKELPYLAKMIDFYTQDLYNVKYPKEFNIRKFVDSFITDHLCKTYKMCKKVLVRVISELKLGWYVTSSRVITPIQEHDFSINKTATKIKVLYISSKETNIPKLLRYILENVKNITSEKLYEGSIDGYITNYMKTLVL